MDDAMRLYAEVEALKIAVAAIVSALPRSKLSELRALAEAHCELEQSLLRATMTPDEQIDHVRLTVDVLLTHATARKPRRSA